MPWDDRTYPTKQVDIKGPNTKGTPFPDSGTSIKKTPTVTSYPASPKVTSYPCGPTGVPGGTK